jgi:hypothetical protein
LRWEKQTLSVPSKWEVLTTDDDKEEEEEEEEEEVGMRTVGFGKRW